MKPHTYPSLSSMDYRALAWNRAPPTLSTPLLSFSQIPPLGGGTFECTNTPLQQAARLQHVADDNQRMLADLKYVLWQNAIGQERYPTKGAFSAP